MKQQKHDSPMFFNPVCFKDGLTFEDFEEIICAYMLNNVFLALKTENLTKVNLFECYRLILTNHTISKPPMILKFPNKNPVKRFRL